MHPGSRFANFSIYALLHLCKCARGLYSCPSKWGNPYVMGCNSQRNLGCCGSIESETTTLGFVDAWAETVAVLLNAEYPMPEFEISAADDARRGRRSAPICGAAYGRLQRSIWAVAVQHTGRTRDGENTRLRKFSPHEATNPRGAVKPATDGALLLRVTRVSVVPTTLPTSVHVSAGGERT